MSNENKNVPNTESQQAAVSATKIESTNVEAKGLVDIGKDIAAGAAKGAVKGAVQGAIAGGLDGALTEVNKAAVNAAAAKEAKDTAATPSKA